MVIYGVYVLSKSGGLIFNHECNIPIIEIEKTFTYPMSIHLKYDCKTHNNIEVDFGQTDGIKVGHVLISVDGDPVSNGRLTDGRNVMEIIEHAENFPVKLRFGRPKLNINEKMSALSRFYSLCAFEVQLSPVPKNSTIQVLQTDVFKVHCYETLTGVKFIVIADPAQSRLDVLLKRIYELYVDYALKDPFYTMDMPILSELFDTNLKLLLDRLEKFKVIHDV